jgi:hypothetical protein
LMYLASLSALEDVGMQGGIICCIAMHACIHVKYV